MVTLCISTFKKLVTIKKKEQLYFWSFQECLSQYSKEAEKVKVPFTGFSHSLSRLISQQEKLALSIFVASINGVII